MYKRKREEIEKLTFRGVRNENSFEVDAALAPAGNRNINRPSIFNTYLNHDTRTRRALANSVVK